MSPGSMSPSQVGPLLLAAVRRPPSRLGEHLLLTLVVLAGAVLCLAAMAWGWRRRARRQEPMLAPLPQAPGHPGAPLVAPMDGVYIGTVGAGGWQDRIVARGLGRRAGGDLVVTAAGIDLAGLWLPRAGLRSARVDDALAGKVMPGAGLLVVGWEHGGMLLESGFRGRASRYPEVLDAVGGLISTHQSAAQEVL